jgi:hypothetical protein
VTQTPRPTGKLIDARSALHEQAIPLAERRLGVLARAIEELAAAIRLGLTHAGALLAEIGAAMVTPERIDPRR